MSDEPSKIAFPTDLSVENDLGSAGVPLRSPRPTNVVNVTALNNASTLAEQVSTSYASRTPSMQVTPGLFNTLLPSTGPKSMVTRPPTRTSVHSRVSFAKGGKSIILNPKHDPIARPATTTGTSPAHNTRSRTSSMVKIIQAQRPPSIQPSVYSQDGLQYTPSPSPVPNTNPPTPMIPISALPIPINPMPEPPTGQTIILSQESSPIEDWQPTPKHSPLPADNPVLNYSNPTQHPSPAPVTFRYPVEVANESHAPNNRLERAVTDANNFSKSTGFLNTLAQVDTGNIGGLRQQSEPLPDSHVPDNRRLFPIPIPNPTSNSDSALNGIMQNLNVVLRRQEYSISQNLVQLENLNSSIVDVELAQQITDSKVDQNTESISKLSEDMINFRKSMGKSRADQQLFQPSSLNTTPPQQASDVLEELRRLSANVLSLASQFGAMQNSISNLENRFSSAQTEETFGNPPAPSQASQPSNQLPITLSNSNPWKNTLGQNNPFDTQPRQPPTQKISVTDRDQHVMQEYNLNYTSNLDEGHIWFSDKAISLDTKVITAWARVVSMGQWGQLQPDGSVLTVGFTANTQRKKQFLLQSIRQAFGPNGYYAFPLPPSGPIPSGNVEDSVRFYSWMTWTGIGEFKNMRRRTGPVRVTYPPNRGPHTIKYSDFRPTFPNVQNTIPPPSHIPDTSVPQAPQAPAPLPPLPPPQQTVQNQNQDQTVAFYEDVYGSMANNGTKDTSPSAWKTVSHNKPSFASMAASSSSKPFTPARKSTVPDSSPKWVLTFSKDSKPSPGTRYSPQIIVDKINLACKAYNIRAMLASWSQAGNLVVTFKYDSKDQNIKNAAATIINLFNPSGTKGCTFVKIVPWSKIVYPKIPCWEDSAEQIDGDAMSTTSLWSPEQLKDAVRASHPLLKDCTFIQGQEPRWTADPSTIPSFASTANIMFSINDPDGLIIASLTSSDAIMFATRIFPQAWKEKINLIQCIRCLKLGVSHPNCTPKCKICGKTDHDESNHNTNCNKCKDTGVPLEQLSSKNWMCTHVRCANCGGSHLADYLACPARNEAIRSARARKSGMTGQTILDPRSIHSHGPSSFGYSAVIRNPAYPSSAPSRF